MVMVVVVVVVVVMVQMLAEKDVGTSASLGW